jgi:hypothetical protein
MDRRCAARGLLGGVTSGAGVAACVCTLIALAGCGSSDEGDSAATQTAGTHQSAYAAYGSSEVVACLQKNGVTVLGDGKLRVSKTMTSAKRRAVETRCGFGEAKVAPPSKKSVVTTATQPQAKPYQSFRSRRIAKVMACLHRAGVDIPSTDIALLSSTSGIKTRSPRVKADIVRCRSQS